MGLSEGSGGAGEFETVAAEDPGDSGQAVDRGMAGTKRQRLRTPAMLKQNQDAQRRYRMRIKLKAAAKDAEILDMRARLGCTEKLAAEVNQLKVELEHRDRQLQLMQQEMALSQNSGGGPSSVSALTEICKMTSEVNNFVDRLNYILHFKVTDDPASTASPVLAVVNDFRTMFDRLVSLVSAPEGIGRGLVTTLQSRKAFDHPSEQSSWLTAAVEALLSQEQVTQIHTLYKQMNTSAEPILMARRSLTENLFGLHSGWENAVSREMRLRKTQVATAMAHEIEGMPAELNATAADISMLLAIAQSTQQKFAEMVNNIMQDSRLEANMDAALLSKVLNESQIAKIIMLTQNKRPSVRMLGLALEKMGAFDLMGGL